MYDAATRGHYAAQRSHQLLAAKRLSISWECPTAAAVNGSMMRTAALIVCSKSPEDHAADAERGSTDEGREASVGRIDELARVNGEGQHGGVLQLPMAFARLRRHGQLDDAVDKS